MSVSGVWLMCQSVLVKEGWPIYLLAPVMEAWPCGFEAWLRIISYHISVCDIFSLFPA